MSLRLRLAVVCLPILLLLSMVAPGSAEASWADRLPHWTPAVARYNCMALATVAIRQAEITRLISTRPSEHRSGAWKLAGTVTLSGAPGGLTRAPFSCTFTAAADVFAVTSASLTLGP